MKRNYINKKGGNNDEIDKDVAYLTVYLFELKALEIIGGVSTKETEIFSTENPLSLSINGNHKNVNFNSHNDNQVVLEKYTKAGRYYQKAQDIVEQNYNNKDILWQDILWAIVQANNDMCKAKIVMCKAKSKNPIIIEDLRHVESLYLNALDILIKVLPEDAIGKGRGGNNLMIIGKSEKISTDLLKTMAKCFVSLGNVNKLIGDHFEVNYYEQHKKLEKEKYNYDYGLKNNFEEKLKKTIFYINSPTFDIEPYTYTYTNKNQEVQQVQEVVYKNGVQVVLEDGRSMGKELPVNYVNYYYIISCMYYKNAHEIYFLVLGEKHWHTQISSFYNMSILCEQYRKSIRTRFIDSYKLGDGVDIYSKKFKSMGSKDTQLPELSFQKELVKIKIVTGDEKVEGHVITGYGKSFLLKGEGLEQVNASDLNTCELYYDIYKKKILEKLDYKYLRHWSRTKDRPSSSHIVPPFRWDPVIDFIEKEKQIRFFLNDYMIGFKHIKLNDTQYYERYITNEEEEEKKKKEIKTIQDVEIEIQQQLTNLLKINIDDVNIVDAIKKKYGELLETRKKIKNIHTFKLLKTIRDKPPKCGQVQCGDSDIDCNVKCKTYIKNEKGGITFCTDLQDKGKKIRVTKITRNNQCTSSNKKIKNNKIGIFHTKDADETQKQGDLVVNPEEITEGLFKIYLDKSK